MTSRRPREHHCGHVSGDPLPRRERSRAEAGWHFANFDAKREQAPVHQGKAGESDYSLITRMADIRASFQNHQVFSNSAVVPSDPEPQYLWIPEMLDGHIHTAWRQLLGPLFSPAAVAALEPNVRGRFSEILDGIVDKGECDFVQEVGLLFPNTIFMDIMGLPRADADLFQHWETEILHTGYAEPGCPGEADGRDDRRQRLLRRADRRTSPRAADRSAQHGAQLADRRRGDPRRRHACVLLLMFMAGLDTVAASSRTASGTSPRTRTIAAASPPTPASSPPPWRSSSATTRSSRPAGR